ncbi:IclR family transcriptional regulator [Devosia sediminis]|uniref:IclR family transcriptional regulator n=1 Tax=Devosia sediminis TaxID=2798801 RepID=A0A934J2B6_9HYPH|nr:IclR family transcriptional regulator [Devosia sediminis]MBJ3786374.1 IclR family transcriptional regulator [Devosia sediminis]
MANDVIEPTVSSGGARERGINRVLQVLEFLHARGEGVKIGALAKELQAPRSSIYNLVSSLAGAGLLEINAADSRVFFGKTMYLYGLNYMRENPLAKRARLEVDRLAKETGETSEFCMLQSGRYTIIHMCPGSRPFRISSAVGLQIPIPWTASGRLLLAGHSPDQISQLIHPRDFFLPDGRQIAIDDFQVAIAQARDDGYCLTKGLIDAYTQCLAAPIYNADGQVDATICLVLPIDADEHRVWDLRGQLVETASRLST